jgi:parallel beta-helix repeat protein
MSRAVLLATMFLILFSLAATTSSYAVYQSNENSWVSGMNHYTYHDPITIANDTDFQNQASSESWSGNGSSISPYIIEGYRIDTESDCITIHSTSVYFMIVDCFLIGVDIGNTGKGVSLWNVQNAHIENSTVSWKDYGVHASHGANFTAVNNDIHEMNGAGILTTYVDTCTLSDNVIYSCGYGIEMNQGVNFTLTSNTVLGCSYNAVWLLQTENCTLIGNSVVDNYQGGISFSEIELGYISENSLISNGLGGQNHFCMGLRLRDSQFITVQSNNISLNHEEGIDWDNSPSCTIKNNVLQYNGWGILMGNSSYSSISSNEISDSESIGIGVHESNNVLVTNNTVSRNGRYENRQAPGLQLTHAHGCEVYDNKLYDNGEYGVELDHCSGCMIYQNEIGWNLAGNSYEYYSPSNNIWFHPSYEAGNYWSDYNGTGEYTIGGYEDSVDSFPSMLLHVNDVLDINPEEFMENVTITWNVYALHPGTYEILYSGETVASGSLQGTIITYDATELVSGSNIFSIRVRDTWGHEVSDTVVILNPISSEDLLPFQILLTITVALLGVGLGIWFLQRRKV